MEGNNRKPNLGKPVPIIILLLLGFIMIYLVSDSGSAEGILSQYGTLTNGGHAGITPQLQFLRIYTMTTGDTTLALRAGLSLDEIEQLVDDGYIDDDGDTSPPPGDWDSSNHNHYALRQNNYTMQFGSSSGTVANNGCGLCSLIAAAAELAGVQYEPEGFIKDFPDTIKAGWLNGTSNAFYSAGVTAFAKEATSSDKIDGSYKVAEFYAPQGGEKNDDVTKQIIDMIIKHCGDSNKVAIISTCGDNSKASNSNGLFTGGGHIICVTDTITENGITYMHMSDSSGVAATNLGKDWKDMANLNFPIKKSDGTYIVTATGKDSNGNPKDKHYWIKWCYILERTD